MAHIASPTGSSERDDKGTNDILKMLQLNIKDHFVDEYDGPVSPTSSCLGLEMEAEKLQ